MTTNVPVSPSVRHHERLWHMLLTGLRDLAIEDVALQRSAKDPLELEEGSWRVRGLVNLGAEERIDGPEVDGILLAVGSGGGSFHDGLKSGSRHLCRNFHNIRSDDERPLPRASFERAHSSVNTREETPEI